MRPKVLILSTSEAKPFAEQLKIGLKRVCSCSLWYEGIFEVGGNVQHSLVRAIRESDLIVAVLTADDRLQSRGRSYLSPRDNVVFEAGISFGANNPGRTILLPELRSTLKLPTDLDGFTRVRPFDKSLPPSEALKDALVEIRSAIRRHGPKGMVVRNLSRRLLREETKALISSAARSVSLYGRDASWAKEYSPVLEDAVNRGVTVEVFCEAPSNKTWSGNLDILRQLGATVHLMQRDLGFRMTMIDDHDECLSRFIFVNKSRNSDVSKPDRFVYRYESHSAEASKALWLTLRRLKTALAP